MTQNTGTIIQVNRLSVDTGGSVTLDKSNAIDQVLAVTSSGGLTVNDSGGGLIVSGPISNGAGDLIKFITTGSALTIQTNLNGGA